MSTEVQETMHALPRTPITGKQAFGLSLLAALGVVEVSKASKIDKTRIENFFFRGDPLSASELTILIRILRRAIHRRTTAAELALMDEPSEADALRSPTRSCIDPASLEDAGHVAF